MKNENNKKVMTLTLIGLMSLILLTIGATYAYFTFASDNQFGSQTIEADVEGIGAGVTLTKVGEGLRLDVSALEMLEENVGTSYYASGSEESATIGKIQVAGDGKFNCTYTMEITKTASSEDADLYNKFQNMSNKSEGQIYLNVNEEVYDFNTENLFPITYTETIRNITSEEYIKANLTIVNANIDQTVLNGADIAINFEVTEFDCTYVDDETAPETFNLALGGIDNPEYTNTEEIEVYLEWEESDVESYCLTEDSTSSNCEWTDVIQTRALTYNTTTTYSLSSEEGEKTVYLYLRDSAYNISNYASDTIILDKSAPTVSSISDAGDGKVTFSASDTHSGVYQYCVNQNGTDTSNCTWYAAVEGSQTTGAIVTESSDYYVHVKDNAGNIGHSSAVTIEVIPPASEEIMAMNPSGLNTSLEGGLYRFQGTTDMVINNYLCFGYTDYETDCDFTNTTNSDRYAYRIIGINESNQLKLIKNEVLMGLTWNSSNGATWPNSVAYSSLNGSAFYLNTTYVSETWKSKIALTTWKHGNILNDTSGVKQEAPEVYAIENSWTSTVSNYIGLMYIHDYYYAYRSGGFYCSSSYASCVNVWLHISNCDPNSGVFNEWSISRYYDTAWGLFSDGRFATNTMTAPLGVRPVFFLEASVKFVGGTGTSTDPFIIS